MAPSRANDRVATGKLARSLAHPDYGTRQRAVVHLISKTDSGNIETVVPHLLAGEPIVRKAAVRALGAADVDAKPFASQLARCLRDRDADVRRYSVCVLGGLGLASAPYVAEIAELLADKDSRVHMAAVVALGTIGIREGPHIDALIKFLRFGFGWTRTCRLEAVKTLCKLGATEGSLKEVLVRYRACGHYGVRHAVKAYSSLFGTTGAAFVTLAGWQTRVRELADALAHCFSCCLTDKSTRVRLRAAFAGVDGGISQCASALALCLVDKDEAVRVQAAKALGEIGNDAEAQLKELGFAAESDRSSAVRLAAEQACIAVRSLYTVLTLHVSSFCADDVVNVSCTNMSGEEMASLAVDIRRPLCEVRSLIACELSELRFQMMLANGRVLTVKDLGRPFAELVDTTPVDASLDDEMI